MSTVRAFPAPDADDGPCGVVEHNDLSVAGAGSHLITAETAFRYEAGKRPHLEFHSLPASDGLRAGARHLSSISVIFDKLESGVNRGFYQDNSTGAILWPGSGVAPARFCSARPDFASSEADEDVPVHTPRNDRGTTWRPGSAHTLYAPEQQDRATRRDRSLVVPGLAEVMFHVKRVSWRSPRLQGVLTARDVRAFPSSSSHTQVSARGPGDRLLPTSIPR